MYSGTDIDCRQPHSHSSFGYLPGDHEFLDTQVSTPYNLSHIVTDIYIRVITATESPASIQTARDLSRASVGFLSWRLRSHDRRGTDDRAASHRAHSNTIAIVYIGQ